MNPLSKHASDFDLAWANSVSAEVSVPPSIAAFGESAEVDDCGEAAAGQLDKPLTSNSVVLLQVRVKGKMAGKGREGLVSRSLGQDSPVWRSRMSSSSGARTCSGLDTPFPSTWKGFSLKKLFGAKLRNGHFISCGGKRNSPYHANL